MKHLTVFGIQESGSPGDKIFCIFRFTVFDECICVKNWPSGFNSRKDNFKSLVVQVDEVSKKLHKQRHKKIPVMNKKRGVIICRLYRPPMDLLP